MKKLLSLSAAVLLALSVTLPVYSEPAAKPASNKAAAPAATSTALPAATSTALPSATSTATAPAKTGKTAIKVVPPPQLSAGSAVLMEVSTGRILYQFNPDEKQFPASTTKVLTALVSLEKVTDMNTKMTASQKAIATIGKGGMNIGIIPGEELTYEDLLHAMLVKSANESASIIAENVSGTIEGFIELENERAQQLGAKNTHFVNANGMHDPNHYTTARDLAIISREAMKYPKFAEIVKKTFYEMPVTNKHKDKIPLYTTNKLLLKKSGFYYPSAIGVKTGYTLEGGNNLVAAAEKNGVQLLTVIMGVRQENNETSVFRQSTKLLEYGYGAFTSAKIVTPGKSMGTVKVENAATEANSKVEVVTDGELKALMPKDPSTWDASDLKITYTTSLPDVVQAPITKGEVLGTAEYSSQGVVLGKVNLVSAKTIEKSLHASTVEAISTPFQNIFLIVGIGVAGGLVLLVMILRFILPRIRRQKRRW